MIPLALLEALRQAEGVPVRPSPSRSITARLSDSSTRDLRTSCSATMAAA